MTFQPGANLYTQGFGSRPENVEVPHYDTRIPTTTDVNFPVGKEWIYIGNSIWKLLSLSSSQGITTALWVELSNATGDVLSVTGTASQILANPTVGNVVLSLIGPYTPATYTAHGVLIGEGSSSIVATSAGTAGQVLTSGGAGADPTWTTATFPATAGATGTILRSNGTNWVASTDTYPNTSTAGALIAATATNVIGEIADVATGQVLMSGGVGVIPAYSGSPSVSGSITAGTSITATLGNITATNGNLSLGTAGNKIVIATGSNASVGTSSAMSGNPGAVVVATTACSATAKVFYSRATAGGTLGNVSITAQDGTGFTLTSTSTNETSTFNWWIINA